LKWDFLIKKFIIHDFEKESNLRGLKFNTPQVSDNLNTIHLKNTHKIRKEFEFEDSHQFSSDN